MNPSRPRSKSTPRLPTPQLGLPPEMRRAFIVVLWAVLIGCVIVGSLLPTASPVMVDIGRLHVNDKVMHFCAYLALSLLPDFGTGGEEL